MVRERLAREAAVTAAAVAATKVPQPLPRPETKGERLSLLASTRNLAQPPATGFNNTKARGRGKNPISYLSSLSLKQLRE